MASPPARPEGEPAGSPRRPGARGRRRGPWGAALRLLGVAAFARGFLLAKRELPGREGAAAAPGRRQYDKVVLVVVDALRWDFVAAPPPDGGGGGARPQPHRGALRAFRELAATRGGHAALFQFEADPPTNTLQRLKGLMTGSLPTFVDFSASFSARAVAEDSLLRQLRRAGRRVYFAGDDTWTALFPGLFAEAFPYPSFNVADLDTVDDGVHLHTEAALARPGDWDVFVGHFLGVDHIGHTHDVHDAKMVERLEVMSAYVERLVARMEAGAGPGGPFRDSLLLVFGDHGQTVDGEHGGGTFEEAVSALFAYAVQPPGGPGAGAGAGPGTGREPGPDGGAPPGRLQQLDFAATLAALLGLPFPHANVGRVCPELWRLRRGGDAGGEPEAAAFREVLEANAAQVHGYLREYAAAGGAYDVFGMDVAESEALYAATVARAGDPAADDRGRVRALLGYLGHAAALAREQWTRFHPPAMAAGLALLAFALARQCRSLADEFALHREAPVRAAQLLPAAGLVALHGAAMLSNSFIMAEGLVVHFLFATSLAVLLAANAARPDRAADGAWRLVLLLGVNRLLWAHSQEHFRLSQADPFAPAPARREAPPALVFAALAGFGFFAAAGLRERRAVAAVRAGVEGPAARALGGVADAVPVLQLLLVGVHWACRTWAPVSDLVRRRLHGGDPRLTVPQAIYALTGVVVAATLGSAVAAGGGWWARVKGGTNPFYARLLRGILPTVLLLHGRTGVWLLFLWHVQSRHLWATTETVFRTFAEDSRRAPAPAGGAGPALVLLLWSLSAPQLFFATGHLCQFASLKFAEAFVGFDEFRFFVQGGLLALNTWTPHLLLVLTVLERTDAGEAPTFAGLPVGAALRGVQIPFTVNALLASVCAAWHRRHLMIYAIFAPKFIFAACTLVVVDGLAWPPLAWAAFGSSRASESSSPAKF